MENKIFALSAGVFCFRIFIILSQLLLPLPLLLWHANFSSETELHSLSIGLHRIVLQIIIQMLRNQTFIALLCT